MLYSRCGSDWRKEHVLTWGGLTSLERIDEKSAEAIVGFGNELPENGGGLSLKRKLKLPINRKKSGIRRPVQFTVLGFGFAPTYRKGEHGKYQLVVSKKGWEKLKQKLKTISRKTTPMSFDERIQKLVEIQRGWINAFRMASIQNKLGYSGNVDPSFR